ncbi:MAG: shikimate dehydrogenase [Taibaiella sp.]|nr:shikimate dehydrogenase [Taibaiella sp.]
MAAEYGIIGYPLGHTFSPAYFNKKFAEENIDAVYTAYPIKDIQHLPVLCKDHRDLQGLSVTIPYKQAVVPYMDSLDITAERTGAVNCIHLHNGLKIGYNTDADGFEKSMQPLLRPYHDRALILGTGGAAQAVQYVLAKLGIGYTQVSRGKEGMMSYEEITDDVIRAHPLIINTTPLGTFPQVDECPDIPYSALTDAHLLYDLIYNPAETKFLSLGKAQGAAIKNGYEMLLLQAEAAWQIWNS